MTIIDELRAKYSLYPPEYIDKKLEEWKCRHPGESLEKLREYLSSPIENPREIASNFMLRHGYECNERCIHCCNNEDERRTRRAPKIEELYKQIDTITTQGVVSMIGGEPTMRDDLIDVLKYIKEKGKQVSLNTNGLRLSDEKYFEKITPYIDIIILPIHSSNYDIFDSITQVKESAEKVVTVFKNIVQINRIKIITQTVINQLNYKKLLDTFDMIRDIAPNILDMMLTFPVPIGAAHSIDVVPRYSEIKDYIQPVLKKYGNLIHTYDIPLCYLHPYQNMVLHYEGESGSIEGEKMNHNKRVKIPNCKKCIFDKDCIGVWKEYGELYSEPDLVPVVQI
jgi:MoaA/NifB/PqqE/SkfB family radical SAM enzyme